MKIQVTKYQLTTHCVYPTRLHASVLSCSVVVSRISAVLVAAAQVKFFWSFGLLTQVSHLDENEHKSKPPSEMQEW